MFFKKKIQVLNPFEGEVVSLDTLPDPVFAQRMMGDGVAVLPVNNRCISPADGTVVTVFPTRHAVVVRTKEDIEVLVHIGLDTVSLKGEGFENHVQPGQKVKAGDLLITFDREAIAQKKSLLSPVIITNLDEKKARIETARGRGLFEVVI
ncbi:PTS sugar transporter subunit IIA [Effusibacillus consociatus]|uniref:PTS glucose transporter subunit IIA n=1 Tax=Effusibacillus consociatus TaxID=1117041 RepID=A0ABV9Q377_9BACL